MGFHGLILGGREMSGGMIDDQKSFGANFITDMKCMS